MKESKVESRESKAKGASRGAWARLNELRLRCNAGVLPTCAVLGLHFGVSGKTIYRDMEELRNTGYGIKFDVVRTCYLVTLPPREPMVPLVKLPLHRPTHHCPPEEAL